MANSKSEVSILISAKDGASRVIKGATDTVEAAAKKATQTINDLANKSALAEAALRKMGLTETQITAALGKMGLATQQNSSATGKLADQYSAFRINATQVNTEVHSVAAGMEKATSGSVKMTSGMALASAQYATTKAKAAELKKTQEGLTAAFKDTAAQIPFLGTGLSLIQSLLASGPGLLAAFAGGLALITIKAIEMADRVQQSLLILRNQIPGVGKDLTKLREIIAEISKSDPLGRSEEEIAGIGRAIARQGVKDLQQFKENLELVVEAANASGESTDALAEGLDHLSDSFQLSGDELAQTFAKIVTAANGLVPLPELFQALSRGSTTLAAFGIDAETAAQAMISFKNAGIPGREAGLALVRVLSQVRDIGHPVTEELENNAKAAKALGIDFSEAHIKSVGFKSFMQELQDKTHGSEVALTSMGFVDKEVTAIIRGDFTPAVIAGADALKKMKDQSDAAGESVGAMSKRLHNELDAQLVKLGTELLPPVISLLRTMNAVLDEIFSGKIADTGKLGIIESIMSALSGPLNPLSQQGIADGATRVGLAWGAKFRAGVEDAVKKIETPVIKPVKNTAIRDEAFEPDAKKNADADNKAKEEAGRRARAAADQQKNDDKHKKALEDELSLIQTRVQLGKSTQKDEQQLTTLETAITKELASQNISQQRRSDDEQALAKIEDIRRTKLDQEITVIEQRLELGKGTNADAQRLTDIYGETLAKLESGKLNLQQQAQAYQLLIKLATDLSKVPVPLGRNIGVVRDQTRATGSATPAEEQAARDAANQSASEGGSGFIKGIGGEAGPSPLTLARADEAVKKLDALKKKSEEFIRSIRDAIAGGITGLFDAFQKLGTSTKTVEKVLDSSGRILKDQFGNDVEKVTEDVYGLGDAFLDMLRSFVTAVQGVLAQNFADKLARSLFPDPTADAVKVGGQSTIGTVVGTAQQGLDKVGAGQAAAAAATQSAAAATQSAAAAEQAAAAPQQASAAPQQIGAAGQQVAAAAQQIAAAPQQGAAATIMGGAASAFAAAVSAFVAAIAAQAATDTVNTVVSGATDAAAFAKDGGVFYTEPFFAAQRFAFGTGMVRGPGTGTSDSIPAWLSNGEGVLTARTVQNVGGEAGVNFLNSLRTPIGVHGLRGLSGLLTAAGSPERQGVDVSGHVSVGLDDGLLEHRVEGALIRVLPRHPKLIRRLGSR